MYLQSLLCLGVLTSFNMWCVSPATIAAQTGRVEIAATFNTTLPPGQKPYTMDTDPGLTTEGPIDIDTAPPYAREARYRDCTRHLAREGSTRKFVSCLRDVFRSKRNNLKARNPKAKKITGKRARIGGKRA